MLVLQLPDKDDKVNRALKELSEIGEMCIYRHQLFGEDACNKCMFHDKSGCQIEDMPECWLRRKEETIKESETKQQ